MKLIRAVEELIIREYPNDQMQTPVHLSVGQEAVSVALCSCLTSKDWKIGTHRSHALYLANGGDLVALFCELLGKPQGCSGGKGGSMHLTDMKHGLVGTTSIVGGCLAIACGLGEACKRGQVVLCMFGDGAADEGVFMEAINWADLRNLPIIFACENNNIACDTPYRERRTFLPSAVPALTRDFQDMTFRPDFLCSDFDVYVYLAEAIHRHVRQRRRPLFLEFDVTRAMSHNGIVQEQDLGRDDPLQVMRDHMQQCQWLQIDKEVEQEVEAAWKCAMEMPDG